MDSNQIMIDGDPSALNFSHRHRGESLLYAAMIEDALEELGIIKKDIQRMITLPDWIESRSWILDASPSDGEDGNGVGFVFACEAVPVDPVWLRNYIMNFKCECCNELCIEEPCKRVVTDAYKWKFCE